MGSACRKRWRALGWGSRREIDAWIVAGRITINGRAAEPGTRVSVGDVVQLDGGRARRMRAADAAIRVLAYNKPSGVVCTRHDPQGRPTIFAQLPRISSGRWINIGRLDINTSGLLLLTNHGELAHRLMHPRYRADREYAARIYGYLGDDKLRELRKGVRIDGEVCRFEDIVRGEGASTNRWYYCVLQSGRNREVRRLWETQGVKVSRLMRVRFANVMLPTDLRAGASVELGGQLLADLLALVRLSSAADNAVRTDHA